MTSEDSAIEIICLPKVFVMTNNSTSTYRNLSDISSRILFLLLFLAAGDSVVFAQSALELHRQKFDWLIQKDTVALNRVLHPGVVYTHSNAWRESKKEVLGNLLSGHLRYDQVEVLEARLIQEGSTQVVVGRGIFQVALDGKPLTIDLSYTEVYVETSLGLRLIARHACKTPAAQ